jgi:hypothetical protein
MPKRIVLAEHLSKEELERKYRQARSGTEGMGNPQTDDLSTAGTQTSP